MNTITNPHVKTLSVIVKTFLEVTKTFLSKNIEGYEMKVNLKVSFLKIVRFRKLKLHEVILLRLS